MLNEIFDQTKVKMDRSIEALENAFKRIRTGRANPSILDPITVDYYGQQTEISAVANIGVEDGRTLTITPWEKPMVVAIEKAIMKSDLGLNPQTSGETIRLVMPMLTEETRKNYIKDAKAEAENGRISVRNVRKAANTDVKNLLKDKEITEDEAHAAEDQIQKMTNTFIETIDKRLAEKETQLLTV
ncbi:ribosome recycling factor [Marinicellulosiphila megalodicopiae]|uniref:ribosome recycling factor n=1 Tax=Marinicellulosiphila megalodicopiae TaxID=2724896 RepID=UPI003BAF9A6A